MLTNDNDINIKRKYLQWQKIEIIKLTTISRIIITIDIIPQTIKIQINKQTTKIDIWDEWKWNDIDWN